MWKLRYIWFKLDLQRLYYRIFHNIKMGGFNDSFIPHLGKGKFVDVIRKGNIIDIISHTDHPNIKQGTIRLIPYQENHGVMIEFINVEGEMEWRTHMDYDFFYSKGHRSQEGN